MTEFEDLLSKYKKDSSEEDARHKNALKELESPLRGDLDSRITERKGFLWVAEGLVEDKKFGDADEILEFARRYEEGYDKSEYVFVPGDSSRAAFLAAKNRLPYSDELDKIGRILGFKIENTGTQLNKRPFIRHITNEQALRLASAVGGFILSMDYQLDFLELLLEGMHGENVVHDSNGNPIDKEVIEGIFNEYAGKGDPLRGVHLDGQGSLKEDHVVVRRHTLGQDGSLQKTENRFDAQKLVRRIKGINGKYNKDLRFYGDLPYGIDTHRRHVLGFYANSDRFMFSTVSAPQDSDQAFGVQIARSAPEELVKRLKNNL